MPIEETWTLNSDGDLCMNEHPIWIESPMKSGFFTVRSDFHGVNGITMGSLEAAKTEAYRLAKEIDAFTPVEPTTTTIGSVMVHVTLTINLPDNLKIDLNIDLNEYVTVDNIVTSALTLYPTATSIVIVLS